MKVKSVTFTGKKDVFNMEVEGTHDFVVQGGVVAHNCADEARYFCMMNPVPPRHKIPVDNWAFNPLKLYLDIEPEDLR